MDIAREVSANIPSINLSDVRRYWVLDRHTWTLKREDGAGPKSRRIAGSQGEQGGQIIDFLSPEGLTLKEEAALSRDTSRHFPLASAKEG